MVLLMKQNDLSFLKHESSLTFLMRFVARLCKKKYLTCLIHDYMIPKLIWFTICANYYFFNGIKTKYLKTKNMTPTLSAVAIIHADVLHKWLNWKKWQDGTYLFGCYFKLNWMLLIAVLWNLIEKDKIVFVFLFKWYHKS